MRRITTQRRWRGNSGCLLITSLTPSSERFPQKRFKNITSRCSTYTSNITPWKLLDLLQSYCRNVSLFLSDMSRKRIRSPFFREFVHLKHPHTSRDSTKNKIPAACGQLIAITDLTGLTENPEKVTCMECKKTLAYKRAVEGTPEGDKIWREALLRRISRL